jgi:hypothetical protein
MVPTSLASRATPIRATAGTLRRDDGDLLLSGCLHSISEHAMQTAMSAEKPAVPGHKAGNYCVGGAKHVSERHSYLAFWPCPRPANVMSLTSRRSLETSREVSRDGQRGHVLLEIVKRQGVQRSDRPTTRDGRIEVI